MPLRPLANHHFEFLDIKGGCSGLFGFTFVDTVKSLYNVTLYNRIFNIRHKIAGDGSLSINSVTIKKSEIWDSRLAELNRFIDMETDFLLK